MPCMLWRKLNSCACVRESGRERLLRLSWMKEYLISISLRWGAAGSLHLQSVVELKKGNVCSITPESNILFKGVPAQNHFLPLALLILIYYYLLQLYLFMSQVSVRSFVFAFKWICAWDHFRQNEAAVMNVMQLFEGARIFFGLLRLLWHACCNAWISVTLDFRCSYLFPALLIMKGST